MALASGRRGQVELRGGKRARMIQASEPSRFETIFSHVEPDGTNTHVAVQRLLAWVEANEARLKWVRVPIEQRVIELFNQGQSIDISRALELATKPGFPPIIYGMTGTETQGRPDVFLIDGHHRYVAAMFKGQPTVAAYILEQSQWREFQIEGLEALSAAQLRDMPVVHEQAARVARKWGSES